MKFDTPIDQHSHWYGTRTNLMRIKKCKKWHPTHSDCEYRSIKVVKFIWHSSMIETEDFRSGKEQVPRVDLTYLHRGSNYLIGIRGRDRIKKISNWHTRQSWEKGNIWEIL